MFALDNIDKYIGNLSQVAGIKHFEFKSGKAKGVEAFEVRTGAGLTYTVLKDRALDIAWAEYRGQPFGYIANVGVAAPAYFEPEGLGFLRNFTVGFLSTCGLTYCGAPCTDQGKTLGLHGRIGNIPAEEAGFETIREKNEITFKIKGKIREAAFFGENLVLERELSSRFGENKILIHDRITNQGFETQPLMILYHFNYGFPLLQETTELVFPLKSVKPRDPRAAEGLGRHQQIEPPQKGYAEQVYYLELAAKAGGETMVGLLNRKLGFGVYQKFNIKELPQFIQWKQMGEGFYVLGLEPANCLPEGRNRERDRGTLELIEPGAVREFSLEIGILESEQAMNEFRGQAQGLK